MKTKWMISFFLLGISVELQAQQPEQAQNLPQVLVNPDISTHFISPEPIQYVDISTEQVKGDLPLSHVLRIKPVSENPDKLGVVTIVGQQFMVQYQLKLSRAEQATSSLVISPESVQELLHQQQSLTEPEIKTLALKVLQYKKQNIYRHKKAEIILSVNNIFSVGDYFFIDVSLKNLSNIPFDLDHWRFSLEDRKKVKATNVQSLEIQPEFTLYPQVKSFKKHYRNVFVFKKFTFARSKQFQLQLYEVSPSGRNLTGHIRYKDLLKADLL